MDKLILKQNKPLDLIMKFEDLDNLVYEFQRKKINIFQIRIMCFFSLKGQVSNKTYVRGVRSRCRRFLNQLLTCVNVKPVLFASKRFSSGVG